VATLTKAFDTLPQAIKWVHAAALAAVALSVLLLMTPAALHRLAFHGEDDPQFFEIGSRLVVTAALPLALGISGDIAVVGYKITESNWVKQRKNSENGSFVLVRVHRSVEETITS
jgi:hypothetical protein